MQISDREVLALLVSRYKTPAAAAQALGLPHQFYYNWRERGVPRSWRRVIWKMCRARGIRLGAEWCGYPKNTQERAAIRRASSFARSNNEGDSDGKAASTDEGQGDERQRLDERPLDQRRPAAGRSIPAVAR